MAINYQKKMEEILEGISSSDQPVPSLLLHSCCGPCSTAVIASLSSFFDITVFYYNPNIDDRDEYRKRAHEQERLLRLMPTPNRVAFREGEYRPEDFLVGAEPFAREQEGGDRCMFCYGLRLDRTAREARDGNFSYFTTTLTVSPMKNAERINEIGSTLAEKYHRLWLPSDFKKKNGYLRSIELSKEYGLYRQNYCGCSFSRRESDRELD
jgi:predicted adenine nucleotide alpha hydrolase (AANH) superfamily ATPase